MEWRSPRRKCAREGCITGVRGVHDQGMRSMNHGHRTREEYGQGPQDARDAQDARMGVQGPHGSGTRDAADGARGAPWVGAHRLWRRGAGAPEAGPTWASKAGHMRAPEAGCTWTPETGREGAQDVARARVLVATMPRAGTGGRSRERRRQLF